MLRVRLGDDLGDADLTLVAQRTERATGVVIEQLVADARRIARQAGRSLALDDFLAVAGEAEANTPPDLLRRTALHEAGRACVAALTIGTEAMVVALQARGGAGGWLDLTGAQRTAGTRAKVESAIRVLLAGRAAEDLVGATRLAAHLYGHWGLANGRLLALGHDDPAALLAAPDLRADASALLDTFYAEACAILRAHRDALHRVADRLLAERRLNAAAVAALIGSQAGPHTTRSGTIFPRQPA